MNSSLKIVILFILIYSFCVISFFLLFNNSFYEISSKDIRNWAEDYYDEFTKPNESKFKSLNTDNKKIINIAKIKDNSLSNSNHKLHNDFEKRDEKINFVSSNNEKYKKKIIKINYFFDKKKSTNASFKLPYQFFTLDDNNDMIDNDGNSVDIGFSVILNSIFFYDHPVVTDKKQIPNASTEAIAYNSDFKKISVSDFSKDNFYKVLMSYKHNNPYTINYKKIRVKLGIKTQQSFKALKFNLFDKKTKIVCSSLDLKKKVSNNVLINHELYSETGILKYEPHEDMRMVLPFFLDKDNADIDLSESSHVKLLSHDYYMLKSMPGSLQKAMTKTKKTHEFELNAEIARYSEKKTCSIILITNVDYDKIVISKAVEFFAIDNEGEIYKSNKINYNKEGSLLVLTFNLPYEKIKKLRFSYYNKFIKVVKDIPRLEPLNDYTNITNLYDIKIKSAFFLNPREQLDFLANKLKLQPVNLRNGNTNNYPKSFQNVSLKEIWDDYLVEHKNHEIVINKPIHKMSVHLKDTIMSKVIKKINHRF